MPDDDRDFIERANSVAEKLHGEPMTTEEIADNFALFGLQKRTAALEKFDSRTARRDRFQPAQPAPARAIDGLAQEDGWRSRSAAQGQALDRSHASDYKPRPRRTGAGADARCADVREMVRAERPVTMSRSASACRTLRRRLRAARHRAALAGDPGHIEAPCLGRPRRSDPRRPGGRSDQRSGQNRSAALLAGRSQAALQIVAV